MIKPSGDILISIVLFFIAFLVDGFFFPTLFNARSNLQNLFAYLLAGGTILMVGGWLAFLIHKYSWRARMKRYFDDLQ